jgi:uncharacterized Zn finger protein
VITTLLKQILIDSGCTLVLYESSQLANLLTDQSNQLDKIGLLLQLDSVILETKANALPEHYTNLTIEVLKQVRLEDLAENNEVKFQECLDTCKEIITRLIASGQVKHFPSPTLTKILEPKYDANVIGWSMPLDLYYLHNEGKDPCLP